MLRNELSPRSASGAGPPLARAVHAVLRLYRLLLSPLLGPCCRFTPSCSHYAEEAIERYGLRRGGWMSVRRLLRCHPFHAGGWDPVI